MFRSIFALLCLLFAVPAWAAVPTYVAAGTYAAGTGTVAPGVPAGTTTDDILIGVCEAQGSESLTVPTGYTAVADSPQSTGVTAADVNLAVFWKRAGASESAPTVADSGNHTSCQLFAFRGVITTGNPWDVTSGGTGASSTSFSITGDTTTVANTLVIVVIGNGQDTTTDQMSGWTNADLTSLTEREDSFTDNANGGGFALATGEKASAGSYTATTGTQANAIGYAFLTIALKPSVSVGITVEGTASSAGVVDTTTITFAHDSGTVGSNCITVVGVAWRNFNSPTISSVTFNSDALTEKTFLTNGSLVAGAIWYILTPDRTSADVVVTFSIATNAAAGAQTYCGVSQSIPFGAATVRTSTGETDTSTSIDVGSATGELVIDLFSRSTGNETVTVGASQTQEYSQDTADTTVADRRASSSREVGATTTTMSWTWTTGSSVVHIGIPLKLTGSVFVPRRGARIFR